MDYWINSFELWYNAVLILLTGYMKNVKNRNNCPPAPFGKIVFFPFSFFSFVFISDYLVEKKPENESFFIIFL